MHTSCVPRRRKRASHGIKQPPSAGTASQHTYQNYWTEMNWSIRFGNVSGELREVQGRRGPIKPRPGRTMKTRFMGRRFKTSGELTQTLRPFISVNLDARHSGKRCDKGMFPKVVLFSCYFGCCSDVNFQHVTSKYFWIFILIILCAYRGVVISQSIS